MNKAFRTLNSLQCGQLLQTITSSQARRQGQQLHAHLLSSNVLFHNTYLNTKLAAMYAAFGCMAEARTLFDRIILKSSFLWNVMVRGCACNRMPLDALALYRDMVAFGKRADNYTYPFVLKACGDLSLIGVGKRVHCEIITCGYKSDVYVGNSLLWMYSKFGELGIVGSLFDRMPERDLTSWNTIISGYAKNGELEKALSVFSVMVRNGVRLDRATVLSVLPACADLMALRKGKEVHAYVLRTCMELDAFLENAIIDVYMNSNFLMGARRLFERMDKRDIVSWNSMICGCARGGDGVVSINLFRKMNLEGLVPDIVTVIAVLGACERIAALQFGRGLHGYVAKKGFDKDVALGTALVDMYAKCGSVTSSHQIFDEMPKRNLISWSTMISGYGLHGQGREAISCLSKMKKEGVRPDAVTFTSALSACSHAGLVTEGKKIFQQMSNEYSITPKVEHYSCMVDLFGRAGKLDEAYDVIKNMEVTPNVDVWAALLSACRVHRNVELAEIAAQNAFHLKPEGVGLYVSLSNIYAVERRWDDVERARAAARQNGLRKPPGCSFVELDMAIHMFLVGDKSHPQSKSIYAKLDELKQQLKIAGYIPDTSSVFYNVEEDVRERMLWDHSERLAIAFVLLNTCPGMSIRITKNLRVCDDCHAVTKLISKLVGRKIIVRDARRFHHFLNGSCSCGDYW